MSTPPPPPPPSSVPPPPSFGGAPDPFGAAPAPTGQPIQFSGPPQLPNPSDDAVSGRSNKKGLMIVAALAAVVLVIVAVVALGGDDDESTGSDAKAAAAGLAKLIDDSGVKVGGEETLDDCPFGDMEAIAQRLDSVVPLQGDVRVKDDPVAQRVNDIGVDAVKCEYTSEDDDAPEVTLEATDVPPGDYEKALNDSFGTIGTLGFDFEPKEVFSGGTVFTYCIEVPDFVTACSSDWVSDTEDVVVQMRITWDELTAEMTNEALKVVLPGALASLASAA